MCKLVGVIVWTLLFVSTSGNAALGESGNMQKTVDSTSNFIKMALQNYGQGVERMVEQKLAQSENDIVKKIQRLIGTASRNITKDNQNISSEELIEFEGYKTQTQTEDVQASLVPLTTENKRRTIKSQEQSLKKLFKDSFISLQTEMKKIFSSTQTELLLMKQEMVSLKSNLSDQVDNLRHDMTLATMNLSDQVDNLRQDMTLATRNLPDQVDNLKHDMTLVTRSLSVQVDTLRQDMTIAATNVSDRVDELTQEIQSVDINSEMLKNYFDDKFDSVANTTNQCLGERKNSDDLETIVKNVFVNTTNQCLGERKNSDDLETIVENVFDDKMKNITQIIENKNAFSENLLDDIRNSSSYVANQLSSGEIIQVLRYLEMLNELDNSADFDCATLLKFDPNLRGNDGVYSIKVSKKKIQVNCDMTTDGGGWTVIQRRVDGTVDFYRNWAEYKNGFGSSKEFWIGNDVLHTMTTKNVQELRVDMESFAGEKAYAVYSTFSVGDEASKYILKVSDYSGNAGDDLSYNNNMTFTNRDRDNDRYGRNCATDYHRSGWWFNWCTYVNPNGVYTDTETSGLQYIAWYAWKDIISLKTIRMMIRPRD